MTYVCENPVAWTNDSVYRFPGFKSLRSYAATLSAVRRKGKKQKVREEARTACASGVEKNGCAICTLLGLLIDPGWFDVSQFGWERYGRLWVGATEVRGLNGSTASVVHRHR
jgi:hypothetical protein